MNGMVPHPTYRPAPPADPRRPQSNPARVIGGSAIVQSGARGVGGSPFQRVTTTPLPDAGAPVEQYGRRGGGGWWGGGWGWPRQVGWGWSGCNAWGCNGFYPVGYPVPYPVNTYSSPWVAVSPYGWGPPYWRPAAMGPYPFGYEGAWGWY